MLNDFNTMIPEDECSKWGLNLCSAYYFHSNHSLGLYQWHGHTQNWSHEDLIPVQHRLSKMEFICGRLFWWLWLKHLPAMWVTQVWSLSREYPLEKEMATHFSILAWRIPWRKEPCRLQSTGLQRVGHDWVTSHTSELFKFSACLWTYFLPLLILSKQLISPLWFLP